jgi:hypothetical protein
MTCMSCLRPFCRTTLLAVSAIAALVLLTPSTIAPARAQAAQQAALAGSAKSDSAKPDTAKPESVKSDDAKSDSVRPAAPTTDATAAGNAAPLDPANPSQPKSLTDKAIEKVKQVAKSASDVFSRVPCLPPKGGATSMGSLPHVSGKLAAGQPVVIVAFG